MGSLYSQMLFGFVAADPFQESMESDILASGSSVQYVWDDLNLPHKLVVEIVGTCCFLNIFTLF